jgi:hypothetical protein
MEGSGCFCFRVLLTGVVSGVFDRRMMVGSWAIGDFIRRVVDERSLIRLSRLTGKRRLI